MQLCTLSLKSRHSNVFNPKTREVASEFEFEFYVIPAMFIFDSSHLTGLSNVHRLKSLETFKCSEIRSAYLHMNIQYIYIYLYTLHIYEIIISSHSIYYVSTIYRAKKTSICFSTSHTLRFLTIFN